MNEPVREEVAAGRVATRPSEVRDILLERLERSAGWLRDEALDPAWVVHEVRKDLKRVRALLRLVEPTIPTRKLEKATAEAARRLSALRDADALLETLDRLAQRAGSGEAAQAVAGVRAFLAAQRGSFEGSRGLPADTAGPVAQALDEVAGGLEAVSFAALDEHLLDEGLARSRAQAARAWRRVARKPSAARMHELRKDVKRELYQRELSGRPFDRMDRAMLKKLADVLGEIQDLEVLRTTLKSEGLWRGPVRLLARDTRRELKQRAGRLASARYGE